MPWVNSIANDRGGIHRPKAVGASPVLAGERILLGAVEDALSQDLLDRARIIEHDPFDDRNWQTAILDQVVVELA